MVLVACGEDEPATPGDSTAAENTPDASVRDLPGDGLAATPDSNVNLPRRQRPELLDALGSRDPRPSRPSLPDAAPPDAGDDASDANGPI